MRRRFFVEKFEGQRAELRGETAEHLGRVLRAEPGQLYELSDGKQVWLGRIERVSRASRASSSVVEFTLVEAIPTGEPGLRVRLLLSIVKFDRFEWCLEKATELGVTEIISLEAERSEKALVQAATKRAERWRKILLESAQQARCLRPPALGGVARPGMAFAESSSNLKIMLSEQPDAPAMSKILSEQSASEVTLAIGPEGGWTEGELAAAEKSGFREASLGRQILRTETAMIAALAIIHYALEKNR